MCESIVETISQELDVRNVTPAQRHSSICEYIDQLAFGASFILINDHDPKPLCGQFQAEYPGQLFWTYIEEGPSVWRVEIGWRDKTTWRLTG